VKLFCGTAAAASGQRRHSCRQYGVLVDDGRPGELIVLCGGTQRVTDAYLSTGNILQVRITAGLAPNDFQRFVVSYTGLFYCISRVRMRSYARRILVYEFRPSLRLKHSSSIGQMSTRR